jgi:hypothetical protein
VPIVLGCKIPHELDALKLEEEEEEEVLFIAGN